MKKKPYLYSTEVDARKTASQIVETLVEAGAREILTQYESGKLVGIRFGLEVNKQTQIYSLPARTETLFKMLCEQRSYGYDAEKVRQQAERTAWRQLLAWVKAQLALIETGMAAVDEVFLPYRQTPDGRTFYELVQAGGQLALPAAQESNVKRFPGA